MSWKQNNLLGIFYHSDGCFDVTFLLVQQAQLKHGKWHQVGVILDIIFTAKKYKLKSLQWVYSIVLKKTKKNKLNALL